MTRMLKVLIFLAGLLFVFSAAQAKAAPFMHPQAEVTAIHDVNGPDAAVLAAATPADPAAASIAGCGTSHCVSLAWTAPSDATSTTTYGIYRESSACPATAPTTTSGFTQIATTPAGALTYIDLTVTPTVGTYCYVATTIIGTQQSGPSNDVQATIVPFAPSNVTEVSQ